MEFAVAPDYRALLDAAGEPILIYRADALLYANRAFLSRLRYDAADVIGRPVTETFVHPQDAPLIASRLHSMMARGGDEPRPPIVVRCICGDGAEILLEGAGVEVDWCGAPAVMVNARVVSDVGRVEALHDAQASFRSVVEYSPDPVLIHRDGVVVYANPALGTLLGRAPAELLSVHVKTLLADTADGARLERRLARMRSEPGPLEPDQFRLRRADGGVAVMEAAAMPLAFDGVPATLVLGRDITDRVRLSRKLMLSERMATLGTLAASVAHEVNNPLAYIAANIDVVQHELRALRHGGAVDLDDLAEALSQAREGAERVAGIVRCLRTFGRGSQAGDHAVDVGNVLERTVGVMGGDVRGRVRLRWPKAPLPPVRGDEARVAQVFHGLLETAMSQVTGGLDLALRAGETYVHATFTFDEDPEPVARVFEQVVAPDEVPTEVGLTLSVCQAIAASLGGDIVVDAGAVTLRLPRYAGGDAGASPARPPAPCRSSACSGYR